MEIVYKLLVVAVALAGFYTGLKRGMLRQLMSLLGVAFGIVCSRVFSPPVSVWLQQKIPFWTEHFAADVVYMVLASAVVFGLVYSIFAVMDTVLHSILGKWEISGLDLIIGAAFRMMRNLLFISIVYNVVAVLDNSSVLVREQRGADANLIEVVMPIAPALLDNGYENFWLLLQLEEAKKISQTTPNTTPLLFVNRKYHIIINTEC